MIRDFMIERFFAEYEFTTPHLLCCSDCETLSVKELFSLGEGYEQEFARLRLNYTETLGHPRLRGEISKLYSSISPDEVLVFSGAEEGIYVFMNTVLHAGDHMIVQTPTYQSLFEVARSLGCEVTPWELHEDEEWQPNIGNLEELVRTNTKVIVINFPNNPTGSLISGEEFKAIAEIARERDILLLSDEVYRFSEYDESDQLPGMCDLYEKGLSLGVMSKSFGLAGLRIGWIATKDRHSFDRLARFKDYTTICNSAPSELLSTMALQNKETVLKRNLDIIANNLALLDDFFERHKNLFAWIRPQAGPVGFPRIKNRLYTEHFYTDLREKAGVLLLPGSIFDYDNSYFRIGFGRRNMPEALAKLEEYIEDNLH